MSDKIIAPAYFGWVNQPDLVEDVVSQLPQKVWGDTEASALSYSDIPEYFSGAEVAEKLLGKKLPDYNQGQVGSCVGFGTTKAVEYVSLYEIGVLKDKEEFKTLAQEVTYGLSRVEIGGGKIVGDGSIGAWAAKAVTQYGVVARGKYGDLDLTAYNESQCRKLGKTGMSKEMENIAKLHPVKSYTKITNWKDAMIALAQGFFISVCSNQGFSSKRDEQGFSKASGNWAHCMAIVGFQKKTANNKLRNGFLIQNSWGDSWNSGGKGTIPMNDGAFWADAEVVDRMLAAGDSFAFSSFEGFKKRQIDWNF